MKTITRPISILLSVLMLMSVLTAAPFTVSAAQVVKSGDTGNCTWTLDNEGTLIISGEGMMCNYYDKNNPAPWGTNIKKVVIENGVTSITCCAFLDCTELTSVTIPEGMIDIGGAAFNNCKKLTSIEIPNSVLSIGDYAFYDCTNLRSVTISNSVTEIGMSMFSYCKNLRSVMIPNGVQRIGFNAFYACNSLKFVTIPDSVMFIDKFALLGNQKLTICGKRNSEAHKYAKNNSMKFKVNEYGTHYPWCG